MKVALKCYPPVTTWSPHSGQQEEGERRGHSFHLSFMTWKCYISLLLVSREPELSWCGYAWPKRGLSVVHLGSLAWRHTRRLSLHQHHFPHTNYEAKTICDFRPDSSQGLVFRKNYSPHSVPPGSSMGIKFDAPCFWIWIFFFFDPKKSVYTEWSAWSNDPDNSRQKTSSS